ncbi:MAG: sugar phosphate isomerase/epimerase family protein [Caldicoprobacterales bacterium]|jgi:3-dehydroshikimate dehydratase|nr:TIM barrel protein [Clostridiales bacterium]
MLETGLVSVSFRKEKPETLIAAVKAAGLKNIEWGGDVHVPSGDLKTARRVGALTVEAGLRTSSYGSYYRLGQESEPVNAFSKVIETAKALGAPVIRLWAGSKGSIQTPLRTRNRMAEEARILAEMAEEKDVILALECHQGTLTDDWKSSAEFLSQVNHSRLRMYWQPNQFRDFEYNLEAASELAAHVVHVHVFHWDKTNRFPLKDGTSDWRMYLDIFQSNWKNDRQTRVMLLEFIHDDRLESLPEEAAVLHSWL